MTSKLDEILENIEEQEPILESDVKLICSLVREIFVEEFNVLRVYSPVIICGDIHGQLSDLQNIFQKNGSPPNSTYLFLGDYIDRGYNSLECLLMLFIYKIKYPDRIFILRGNHESRQITQVYGFYDECFRKYGVLNVWRYCSEIFDYLPLAAIVDEKTFCTHGGLSPFLKSIDDVRNLNRRQEIPYEGLMCDLLWSDPEEIGEFKNNPRGFGCLFGEKMLQEFQRENNIDVFCRAHQLIMEGYNLISIWSAPNYCYRCGNAAAVLEIDNNKKNFKVFDATISVYFFN